MGGVVGCRSWRRGEVEVGGSIDCRKSIRAFAWQAFSVRGKGRDFGDLFS
jgi:hypothetical protein